MILNQILIMRKIYYVLFLMLFVSCNYKNNDIKNLKDNKIIKDSLLLDNVEIQYIGSKINKVEYKLIISLPKDYYSTIDSFSVVYLLDADNSFPLAYYNIDHLSGKAQIPRSIIVGIAYKHYKYWTNRQRDYTPYKISNDTNNITGGAELFKRFIKDELFQFVERHYRTKNEKTLIGKSYGGLFASWTMLTDLEMFDNYLIVSPSLWYSDRKIFNLFDSFKPDKIKNHYIYLAVGSLEHEPFSMIDDLKKFYKLLNDMNINVQFNIFENENHDTVLPAAMSRGLVYTQNKNNIKKLKYFGFDLRNENK
jgi:predicted alpha/beta superfamily hydrolase